MSWLAYASLLLPRRRAEWSIGLYTGSSITALHAHAQTQGKSVLRAASLAPLRARSVADPFMVRHEGHWHLFFEIEDDLTGKGSIGHASSIDGIAWNFTGIALEEPFHLSYPLVFQHEGQWYMIPESSAAHCVSLYRADAFPGGWRKVAALIEGRIVDATAFRHAGRWWIVATEDAGERDAFVIYHADVLAGPWHAHAGNPIRENDRSSRPAGRVIENEGRLVRLTQDGVPNYGRAVRAYSIDELTPDRYAETPLHRGAPILAPGTQGWNSTGMHHADIHRAGDGTWIACVDGRRTRIEWPVANRIRARLTGRAA